MRWPPCSCCLVAGDEVYGADSKLRKHLREAGIGYVLAVAKNHQVVTGIGARRAIDLAVRLPGRSWQRMSAGQAQRANGGMTGRWSRPPPKPTAPPLPARDTTGC